MRALPRAGAVCLLAALGCAEGGGAGGGTGGTLSVTGTLAGGDTAGYARAEAPRPFVFPADHGPHPEYRHEWWYYTGNLDAADGRRFGFQLTFFRSALRPDPPSVDSDWATRQAYMAHFAVTDVDGGRFHAFERFDRGALGLAGARADPFRVWVGDWVAEAVGPAPAGEAVAVRSGPVRLRAGGGGDGGVALELRLTPRKPVVLQGEAGLSRKGPEPGNASYYYSIPRLAAVGTVTVDGAEVPVRGTAWLDREWGTSALGPELEGWDWFSLQLSDGSDLMYYRLRRRDGTADPFSGGSFVGPGGGVTRLGAGDVVVEERRVWESPRGGRYPAAWVLRVPSLGLTLAVDPPVSDQELDLAFRYWEGTVDVRGERAGRGVTGRGYVELTGYAGATGSRSPGAAPGM